LSTSGLLPIRVRRRLGVLTIGLGVIAVLTATSASASPACPTSAAPGSGGGGSVVAAAPVVPISVTLPGLVLASPPAAPSTAPARSTGLSATDLAAIDTAVHTSSLTDAVPDSAYQVTGTTVSTVDPSWAWTGLRPLTAEVDRVDAVLHRDATGWTLVALGSDEVGCGLAPNAVLAGFGIGCHPDANAQPGTAVGDSAVS
jgi:hypothetical protein